MLKFYDVTNKGRGSKSHFIIAKDEEDAMRIAATQAGKPTSIIEMDQTRENIPTLCQGTKTGILGMKCRSFNIYQLVDSKPKPPEIVDPWFFMMEI